MHHEHFIRAALAEAQKCFKKNEVPVGAIAVKGGKIIARGHNLRETKKDPTAHAEIICLRKAAKKLGGWYLKDVTLYSTLSPCVMCLGAILQSRIKELVFGADDPKVRIINPIKPKLKITKGILKEECAIIIKKFFKELRKD